MAAAVPSTNGQKHGFSTPPTPPLQPSLPPPTPRFLHLLLEFCFCCFFFQPPLLTFFSLFVAVAEGAERVHEFGGKRKEGSRKRKGRGAGFTLLLPPPSFSLLLPSSYPSSVGMRFWGFGLLEIRARGGGGGGGCNLPRPPSHTTLHYRGEKSCSKYLHCVRFFIVADAFRCPKQLRNENFFSTFSPLPFHGNDKTAEAPDRNLNIIMSTSHEMLPPTGRTGTKCLFSTFLRKKSCYGLRKKSGRLNGSCSPSTLAATAKEI